MSKFVDVTISDERLSLLGEELLMWGQQHRLKPVELFAVINFMHGWLREQLDVKSVETTKEKNSEQ